MHYDEELSDSSYADFEIEDHPFCKGFNQHEINEFDNRNFMSRVFYSDIY